MTIGYKHTCSAGHVYYKWVFFGDKPECPTCVKLIYADLKRHMYKLRHPSTQLKASYVQSDATKASAAKRRDTDSSANYNAASVDSARDASDFARNISMSNYASSSSYSDSSSSSDSSSCSSD